MTSQIVTRGRDNEVACLEVMNNLLDNFMKLLVAVVATCVAIRLAYDVVRPAIPALSILIVLVVVVRVIAWYRDRW